MIYISLKYQCEISLDYQYTLKEMKDRRVKQAFSRIGYQLEGERHKERMNRVDVFCIPI
jgi:hypothetical protein